VNTRHIARFGATCLGAASLVVAGILTAAPASATSAPQAGSASAPAPAASVLSETDRAEIDALLEKFAVPDAQQDSLLAALDAGQPWDVDDRTAAPVSTEEMVIGDMEYSVDRYADGSVSAAGVQIATEVDPDAVQTRGVKGCSVSSGSGYSTYTGCQVDAVWGLVTIGAHQMSWTNVQGGNDYISDFGIGFQNCFPPNICSTPTNVASRTNEGVEGNAYVRWQSDVSTTAGGSWNAWVQLEVADDTHYFYNS
jgi:hypothetical protein